MLCRPSLRWTLTSRLVTHIRNGTCRVSAPHNGGGDDASAVRPHVAQHAKTPLTRANCGHARPYRLCPYMSTSRVAVCAPLLHML